MAFKLQAVLQFKDESGSGVKSAERNFDGLGDAVKKAGVALGAAFAAKQVVDIAKLGATAQRVEKRFVAFAGGAEQAADMLEAFQEGAGGAASKMQAMESASRLMQMGLVDSTDSMAKTVEMATRLGDQTQGVGERVADFSALLANQSIPRLDNFGISSGRVRDRIKELQAAMPGLSREQAFMNAVMEEGETALGKLGPRADDNLMSFEKLEAKTEDLKVALGQGLAPALSVIIDQLIRLVELADPAIKAFADLTDGVEAGEKQAAATTKGIATLGERLKETADTGLEFADMVNRSIGDMSAWHQVVMALGSDLLGTENRLDVWNQLMQELHTTAASGTQTYQEYLSIIDDYNANVDLAKFRTEHLSEAQWWQASSVLPELTAEANYWDNAMLSNVKRLKEAEEATNNTGTAYVDISGKVSAQQRLWREMTGAMIESSEAAKAHQEAINATASEYVNLASSLKDATDQQLANKLIGMLDPETMGADAFIAATTQIGLTFGTMDEKGIALAGTLPKLAQALTDNIIPAENADEALQALIEDAEDGEVKMNFLIAAFDNAPASFDNARDSTQDFTHEMKAAKDAEEDTTTTTEDMIDTFGNLERMERDATSSTEALGGSVSDLVPPFNDATGAAGELEQQIKDIPDYKKITIEIDVTGDEIPAFQHGGVVPGPIGKARWGLLHGGEIVYNPYAPPPAGNTTHKNFNLTINTRAAHEPIASDFRMMQAVMG